MVSPTTPDNISRWTAADPSSIVQESNTQGDSIQLALLKRMRYTYVWANSAARTAQTGMTQGSLGYQVDTKTEYIYDNSTWRLALSYGEYERSSAQSIPNTTETTLTSVTIDAANTTDTVFATVNSGTGVITLVNPGIYSLSLTVGMSGGLGATSYAALRPDNTGTLPPLSLSGFNASASTVALPFLRTTITNYTIYPRMYQSSGGASNTAYTILRIGRLG